MMRPKTHNKRPTPSNGGTPAWLIFLLGIAVVFGLYYLWLGFRDFAEEGLDQIEQVTQQAAVIITSTQVQIQIQETQAQITPLPTFTPIPDCQDFRVIVDRALIRNAPSTTAAILDSADFGEILCVIQPDVRDIEWYLLDLNPETRRINEGYIFSNLVEAVNPTPTPTDTYTPAPTVTPLPTRLPTNTFTPAPTNTPNPNATPTPTPTREPTPTIAIQSA
ncbi:MAG: hypothetical protein Kow00117_02830 [Phototrophicales bacterium]|nr:MAG: hypothetical protein D6711_13450 [Chloroflexota bacterium]